MSKRVIRVLHIEDDHLQHRLLTHHLGTLDEFAFDVTCAENEQEGLKVFDREGADLIVLDYRLPQGDSLHCLKELRSRDAKIPIIVFSGAASLEIARELVECGADDYLNKSDLSSQSLAQSVYDVLSRWDAWKKMADRYRPARAQCE